MTDTIEPPGSLDVREVGPRDGLQIEAPVPFEAKRRLLDALVATGVRRIEATAFVSPRAVPSMADAELVAAYTRHHPDILWTALVASAGGARRAVDAGLTSLEYVVSAADGHSLANVRRTTAQAVADVATVAGIVHEHGGTCEVIIATAWDCPFDGPTPVARTVDVARRAVELGADQLCLADTIGTTVPGRVRELVEAVREAVSQMGRAVPLSAHFHDTRGMGLANAFTAYQLGITQQDASVGGLGGCPFAPGASGNIATEELVYLFEHSGIETGVDVAAAIAAAAVAAEVVGRPLPSRLLKAGPPLVRA